MLFSYYIYFFCYKCKRDKLCNKIKLIDECKSMKKYSYFFHYIKASQDISLMNSTYPQFFKNYAKKISFVHIHTILCKKCSIDITNYICSYLDAKIIDNTIHHKFKRNKCIDSFSSSIYCIPKYGIIQNLPSSPTFYCDHCIRNYKLCLN